MRTFQRLLREIWPLRSFLQILVFHLMGEVWEKSGDLGSYIQFGWLRLSVPLLHTGELLRSSENSLLLSNQKISFRLYHSLRLVVTSSTQFEFGPHHFNTLFQKTDISDVFPSMSNSSKWPFPISVPRKILHVLTSNNIIREKQILKCFCK